MVGNFQGTISYKIYQQPLENQLLQRSRNFALIFSLPVMPNQVGFRVPFVCQQNVQEFKLFFIEI